MGRVSMKKELRSDRSITLNPNKKSTNHIMLESEFANAESVLTNSLQKLVAKGSVTITEIQRLAKLIPEVSLL